MSNTTIAAFTHGAQQAQQWVNELDDDLNWDDKGRAYRLLRSVLHTLRDFLSIEEVADLSAQLPIVIRGVFFEEWDPSTAPVWKRKKQDFIEQVASDFKNDPLDNSNVAVAAVFKLMDRHISQGEITQVRNSMQKSLRNLWPATHGTR
ncbi:uncharacterized protein (DUF2267 family) [Phyllobacterium trifolii]|uniref:Uncharacterized protein (DUF2267 family) n=1 Tax=Phyllobacterium trifolii TaxID=300193 RepID=A0A839UA47_9HYPH|nr:DUF2267 domain-containing protein [Phyllobacterium trifolii]MBB3146814.1 uncharacterized protein (DUF2267 family) [Phyllobacterium trifolii]